MGSDTIRRREWPVLSLRDQARGAKSFRDWCKNAATDALLKCSENTLAAVSTNGDEPPRTCALRRVSR